MIKELTIVDIDELNELLYNFQCKLTPDTFISNPFAYYIGYVSNNELVAFLGYSVMYDRAEINYIYVKPLYRGVSLASILMEEMIKKCYLKDVKTITLEVKKSNIGAISLYEKFHFEAVAIRKNYYKNEDGILMERVNK